MIADLEEFNNSKPEQDHIPYFIKIDGSNCIIDALVPIKNFNQYLNTFFINYS